MPFTEIMVVGYQIEVLPPPPNEEDGVWTLRLLKGGRVVQDQGFGVDGPTQDQIGQWLRSVFNHPWEAEMVALFSSQVGDIIRAQTVPVRSGSAG